MTTATPGTKTSAAMRAPWTTRNKIGLGLLLVDALVSLPSFQEDGSTGQVGPPSNILVLDSVLAVVALVAVVIGWRSRSRVAVRISCAALVLITITSLPAFFVDVPAFVKLIVAVGVVWTVAAVVLALTPAKRP